MPDGADYFDTEVRAFIDGAPRSSTYSEMARRCVERFGARRAWSRDMIFRYVNDPARPARTRRSRIESDPEVCAFVDDRLGLLTLEELCALCHEQFGAARAPSKSGLHRRWKRLRRTATMAEAAE